MQHFDEVLLLLLQEKMRFSDESSAGILMVEMPSPPCGSAQNGLL